MPAICSRLKTLTARDVMTAPALTVRESVAVRDAIACLTSHEITGLPVVDEHGQLRGMLSLWDVVRKQLPPESDTPSRGLIVSQCMTQPVGTVQAEQSIVEVARRMCNKHWHRLPVVKRDGELVGVISTMDVLAAIVNTFEESEVESKT